MSRDGASSPKLPWDLCSSAAGSARDGLQKLSWGYHTLQIVGSELLLQGECTRREFYPGERSSKAEQVWIFAPPEGALLVKALTWVRRRRRKRPGERIQQGWAELISEPSSLQMKQQQAGDVQQNTDPRGWHW